MDYILPLEKLRAGDQGTGGAKAVNLGVMMQQGFPVPGGFVVTTCAYRHHLEDSDIDNGWSVEGIRERLTKTQFPVLVAREIIQAHQKLSRSYRGELVCAVRSSATDEDTAGASFAGQHATYYYVRESQLLAMIKACWGSLWSDAAVSYRQSQGLDHRAVEMAVIVQRMIPSEISGVVFTNNPVSGNPGEMVVESSWGMGASIVDGRVTPDRFVVERSSGRTVERFIGDKRFMVPADRQSTDQQRMVEVDTKRRRAVSLSEKDISRLMYWSQAAETCFEQPQDIEWAIAAGELFILQSRPISSLGPAFDLSSIKGKYVVFKPLVENFSEPFTPLTADLVGRLPMPGARMIHGWMYLNLAWVRPFIPWRVTDQALADLVYLSGPAPARLPIAWYKLPLLFLVGILGYSVLGGLAARTRNMPDDFMDGFRDRLRRLDRDPEVDGLGVLRQMGLQDRFFEPIGNLVLHINVSGARYFLYLFALKLVLGRWAPDLDDDAIATLCSGGEGIRSADMGHDLWQLSRLAMENDDVREIFTSQAPARVLAFLRDLPQAESFLAELEIFLSGHGHRGIKELELSSPRWEEDPTPVLGMIKNFLAIDESTREQQSQGRERRAQLKQALAERLLTLWLESFTAVRRRLVDFLIRETRYFIKLRENSRFYHIMGFGLVRKKILEAEQSLLGQGKLRCKDDIFYLEWRELEELRSGDFGWRDVEDRIRTRRLQRIHLSKQGSPKTIGLETSANVTLPVEATRLKGRTASPGSYEGWARVILDPTSDVNLEPGEVLIAPYTDPAWTPLFLTANAAVVEVGSYLSHAGTVAREYAMPCIVDVRGCMSRIKTGDVVRVDGPAGEVWIVETAGGARS